MTGPMSTSLAATASRCLELHVFALQLALLPLAVGYLGSIGQQVHPVCPWPGHSNNLRVCSPGYLGGIRGRCDVNVSFRTHLNASVLFELIYTTYVTLKIPSLACRNSARRCLVFPSEKDNDSMIEQDCHWGVMAHAEHHLSLLSVCLFLGTDCTSVADRRPLEAARPASRKWPMHFKCTDL